MNSTTKHVRKPIVAGTFYPEDAATLRRAIRGYLSQAESVGPYPKALIVPHAGYMYSGPVAASGYCLLKPIRQIIDRVVLMGPSHRVPFHGLATCGYDEFATPLGMISIDTQSVSTALKLPQVHVLDEAHKDEHSLEVHLPFLQMTLDHFSLIPFAVGRANASEVSDVLELFWDDTETLIVVSSDLSHYHDYSTARGIDSATAHLIERCQWRQIYGERACGYAGVRGLLRVAQQRGLHVKTVDLRNSGDTAGPKDRVVGYGCFVVY